MRKNAGSLRLRVKYMFAGYKTQNFLNLLRKIVPICALAIFLILSICYIAIHPLDKIKLRYALADNFTMKISVRPASPLEHSFLSSDTEVIVDGDLMQVNRTYALDESTYYYKLESDGIHQYYTNEHGNWRHELIHPDTSRILDIIIGAELLDRDNYKRVEGKLFVWELKENADIYIDRYIVSNIRITRAEGYISIVGETSLNGGECDITVSFKKFGSSDVKPLWEK